MSSEKKSIINLGNDISQVRKELLSFVQKIIVDEEKSPKYHEEIITNYFSISEKNGATDILSSFIAPTLLSVIHSLSLSEILIKLSESKHEIDFTKLWLGELVFILSKSEDYRKIDEKKGMKQGVKDMKKFQRLQDIGEKLQQLGFDPGPHLVSFSKAPKDKGVYISKLGDYGYHELFAYELRQKSVSDIFDFLSYQSKIHEGDNFYSFLDTILIEHKNILEKKTRSATAYTDRTDPLILHL